MRQLTHTTPGAYPAWGSFLWRRYKTLRCCRSEPSKLKVAGSNPAGVANKIKYSRDFSDSKNRKILLGYTPRDTNLGRLPTKEFAAAKERAPRSVMNF